jgi:hypothetical protein
MDAPVLISGLICLRMPYDFSYRSGEVYSIELGTALRISLRIASIRMATVSKYSRDLSTAWPVRSAQSPCLWVTGYGLGPSRRVQRNHIALM